MQVVPDRTCKRHDVTALSMTSDLLTKNKVSGIRLEADATLKPTNVVGRVQAEVDQQLGEGGEERASGVDGSLCATMDSVWLRQ